MSKAETMIPQKGETEPQLRFEGFSGEWSKSQLNKVSKVFIGLVTTMTKSYVQRGIPLIRNSDIKANKINQDKLINLDPEFVELNKSRKLKAGDIVTVHTGDVGVSSVIPSNLDGCIGFATLNTRLMTKEINPYYLALFFNTELFLNWCKSVSTGDGRCNLNLRDFEKAKILHPILEEQTKIGELFQKLDRAIELQQQKVEQSERYKKAMLQKMFPQKGEKVPRVRFAGFSGDWNLEYLYDAIDKVIDFRGRTPLKLGMSWDETGEYLALSALNVKQGYIDYDIDAHFGNEALYQKWMKEHELIKGQVLFTTEAPMGNVAQVPDDRGYILSQRTIAFVTNKKKLLDDFLACLLSSFSVVRELQALASGGTAKGVSQKSLSGLRVKLPISLDEQSLIGNYFQKLDQNIKFEKKKLEQYQTMKRAMLQRMFV